MNHLMYCPSLATTFAHLSSRAQIPLQSVFICWGYPWIKLFFDVFIWAELRISQTKFQSGNRWIKIHLSFNILWLKCLVCAIDSVFCSQYVVSDYLLWFDYNLNIIRLNIIRSLIFSSLLVFSLLFFIADTTFPQNFYLFSNMNPLSNIIDLACANASVMTGSKSSFKTKLYIYIYIYIYMLCTHFQGCSNK